MLGGMTDQVAALGALKRYFGYDSFRPGQSGLVDAILAGEDVRPSRGPDVVQPFKDVSRTLAGFLDEHADEGVAAGPASLAGLEVAREQGWSAPSFDAAERAAAEDATTTPDAAAAESAPQTGGEQSSAERKPTTEADVTPGGPESEPEEKR